MRHYTEAAEGVNMNLIRGWDDAVVGWAVVRGKRHAVYDADRSVVMWERRGLSHDQATHMVLLAMNTRGRRVWVRPADGADLRAAIDRAKHEAQMRKIKGEAEEE
jgi:hypothetical protein